jgi:hypothetical protein
MHDRKAKPVPCRVVEMAAQLGCEACARGAKSTAAPYCLRGERAAAVSKVLALAGVER